MTENRVFLPDVLADAYGIAVKQAQNQMELGEVYIDGHEVNRKDFWFYPASLEGKKIEVRTAQKVYTFEYQAPSFRR